MKLFIMRHAEAESGMQMDPTRKLTDTGKRQAKMMSKWLARQDIEKPDIVVHSSFQRAISTAKRVAKHLDVPMVQAYNGTLDPDGHPEKTWTDLKKIARDNQAKSLIAVTHGPLVEKLLAYLTGAPLPQQFHYAHAAIAHLETTNGARGILHWLVTPNVVARDEDELQNVTHDAHATIEAALSIAELAVASMSD
jgi:phosphohistidine phosphatase SixA